MSDMAHMDRSKTASECVGMLVAVLGCLDSLAADAGSDADDSSCRALSFAAIRGQEAIDLLGPTDPLNS